MTFDRFAPLVEDARVYDLGQPFELGMSQSPNHPRYQLALLRRHGDNVRADGGSAANELIVTSGHVGTHVDAFCHVSQDGYLHGGVDAGEAQRGGLFSQHGIETVAPFFCRRVLLDVAGLHGVPVLEAGHGVTAEELRRSAERQQVEVRPGDAVLVRTGWSAHWREPEIFIGWKDGAPGPNSEAAEWLAERGIRASGADTVAYEEIPPGRGHSLLPVHRIFLVERGIHIIEMLQLDELAADEVWEFLFVASPLQLVGGTGSPVRPLAVV